MIGQVALPTPDTVIGPVKQAVGEALKRGAGSVVDGFSEWLFSSLGDLCGSVFGFIDKSTTPNLLSGWFIDGSGGPGPYKTMATVAASLMCVLVFAGVVQGIAHADLGAMLKTMVLHVPVGVIGITGTVVVAQILIELTDALAKHLTSAVGTDTQSFVTTVQSITSTSGSGAAPTVVLGLLMLVAALVVFVELLIRSLLIYLIVALCPLAWAALVWPALQSALRKTLELLVAVILSKVVVALAIAVGAAAISGIGTSQISPGLDGYRFAKPGTTAASAGELGASGPDTMTEGVGLLAIGVATLALAAFSPFLIARLLPFAEAAVVSQGTRGAPVRAGQQASSLNYQLGAMNRFHRFQHHGSGGGHDTTGSGSPSGARSRPQHSGPNERSGAGTGDGAARDAKANSAAKPDPGAGRGGAKTAAPGTAGGAGGGVSSGAGAGGGAAGGAAAGGVAAGAAVVLEAGAAAARTGKERATKAATQQGSAAGNSAGGGASDPAPASSVEPTRPAGSPSTLRRLGERPDPNRRSRP